MEEINKIDIAQLNRIGLKTCEKGKWAIHESLQHLIDWERIWYFRTKQQKTGLPKNEQQIKKVNRILSVKN